MTENYRDSLNDPSRWNPLNDPKRWADLSMIKPPATFNAKRFQKLIDRTMGVNAQGKSIVRLVWAWDQQQFEAGEMRQKYRFYSWQGPDGKIIDISPPRWILEERNEPGQYMPTWQSARWVRVPDEFGLSGYKVIDALGDPPVDGWYTPLYTIAEHDENNRCCDKLKVQGRKCWGYYREPSWTDIQVLRDARAKRDRTAYKQSPNDPLSEETVMEAFREGAAWNEAESIPKQKRLYDMWVDHIETWGWQIGETNHKRLTHGRHHVMPTKRFGETASGLLVPTN